MEDDDELAAERARLRLTCRHLSAHGLAHPAAEFEAIAQWLRENAVRADGAELSGAVEPDVYGTGALVEDFEAEVAALFGKPAARFMPSGCMAQPIALRIWADRAGNPRTAFHATSHLELHEEHAYRELHGLDAHLLGERTRPTLARDVAALIGAGGPAGEGGIASVLVELPAREIGGQLPTWEELVELSAFCRGKDIRLHLDGARVWQAAAAYGRTLAQLGELFDSIYVSFYKDVGALPGAMLIGSDEFIQEAAIWQRRQGGTLYTAMANVVSARMRLPVCLERMPALVGRARTVADLFTRHVGVNVLPDPPQTNMFHLMIEGDRDDILAARDRAARETDIWLFGNVSPVEGEGACKAEITMGEASLALGDDELAVAISTLLAS